MKTIITFFFLVIMMFAANAQNGFVGVGQSSPISKLDVNGNVTIGNSGPYSGVRVAPVNGLRVQGQTVFGKPTGEDSRDQFSSHTDSTAFVNVLGYPGVGSKRAIAGYGKDSSIGVFGYSSNKGYGVVGLTQQSTLSPYIQGGEGVLGQADGSTIAGASNFPIGVHGIIDETTSGNNEATPVLGENNNITTGVSLTGGPYGGGAVAGVYGNIGTRVASSTTNAYQFGVIGDILEVGSGNIARATGGVLGFSGVGTTFGVLGYNARNGNNYSVYGGGGTNNGTIVTGNTGRMSSSSQANNHVGIGINGGFWGGYISGSKLGMISSGNDFGIYSMGKTISNQPIVQLNTIDNSDKRIPTYASMSTTVDVNSRGVAMLQKGSTFISFDNNFKNIVDSKQPITITVTPTGESNGVYVAQITDAGFYVKENRNGNSNVSLNWIAIGTQKNAEQAKVDDFILSKDFDKKMSDVMIDDATPNEDFKQPIYFDGKQILFENIPDGLVISSKKLSKKNNATIPSLNKSK
jgi:hypothetical protein